ncbi:DUF1579 domain-containing protein [Chitinophaga oryziterrae]|uniref:DUF1579 domain-containing protein n=1 Tax=Chitinophaga oryziterrae TaxID=1031224 RepID=A0A6N8J622_9BACT|nr:DUF1579 domain-containing protein [Chitinophaga oryziterrae]MVT40687.1 DUF1579 domain-containing protein [Chitinophaga oryziterrae]
MKRLLLFVTAILPFFHAKAQNADQQAAQKAWTEYMTPGEIHRMLAKDDGEWTYDLTYWMTPGATPTSSTGTTENKMVLGGRYQESVHKGNMEGMPFEGHSLLGYDNAKKIFQNTWADNMGTGIMLMEGKWDDATKTITLTGKSYDPMLGKDVEMRQVYKIVDDDHHTLEMYTPVAGKEFKNMEIRYTRKKM